MPRAAKAAHTSDSQLHLVGLTKAGIIVMGLALAVVVVRAAMALGRHRWACSQRAHLGQSASRRCR